MGKAEIYVKQKESCPSGQKHVSRSKSKLVLKKNAKVRRIYPAKQMLNQKHLAEALWQCLKDNDPEAFIEIIDGYLLAMSVTKGKIVSDSNIPKTTLYHSMKSKNPTLKTFRISEHAAIRSQEREIPITITKKVLLRGFHEKKRDKFNDEFCRWRYVFRLNENHLGKPIIVIITFVEEIMHVVTLNLPMSKDRGF